MQFIDKFHQFKINRFHKRRLPINARSCQLQQRTLPRYRQISASELNLFDPLRPAYFLSAANAIFALNFALCFLRDFDIFIPFS